MSTLVVLLWVVYTLIGFKLIYRGIRALVKKTQFLNESTTRFLTIVAVLHVLALFGYIAYLVIRGLVHASL